MYLDMIIWWLHFKGLDKVSYCLSSIVVESNLLYKIELEVSSCNQSLLSYNSKIREHWQFRTYLDCWFVFIIMYYNCIYFIYLSIFKSLFV